MAEELNRVVLPSNLFEMMEGKLNPTNSRDKLNNEK